MNSRNRLGPVGISVLALTLLTVPTRLHALEASPELTAGETAYCAGKAALVGAIWGAFEAGVSLGRCLTEEAND